MEKKINFLLAPENYCVKVLFECNFNIKQTINISGSFRLFTIQLTHIACDKEPSLKTSYQ